VPAEVSTAVLVRRQPSLLTTAGVQYSIRGALAELRDVLPEACVCWLLLEVRALACCRGARA
jgi:hypothetical protein